MHSHISSVIYASITQKEMYLVSHVLNCINWKRGLTLCRGTGTPLPQPRLQTSPALGGSGTLRLAPEVLPAESLPQSLSVSSGLVPAASEHLRRHNEVV